MNVDNLTLDSFCELTNIISMHFGYGSGDFSALFPVVKKNIELYGFTKFTYETRFNQKMILFFVRNDFGDLYIDTTLHDTSDVMLNEVMYATETMFEQHLSEYFTSKK